MKKVICMILALMLCLGLCACGEDENKTAANIHPDYVGEWKCMRVTSSEGDSAEYTITLNKDGTGSYDNINGKWRYSEENDWAVLEIDLGNVVMKLAEAEGTTVLKCYGDIYYRAEEFMEYGTETITITADNWQDYFEWQFRPEPEYNDFGEITNLYWALYFQLRSEYSSRLLTGEIIGEYLLSEPLIHNAWCEVFGSDSMTYNYTPHEGDYTGVTIDPEEISQSTFTVTLQHNESKSARISNQAWGGYADSITKADNRITMLVTLFSKIDLLRVEGSITVFK